MILDKPKAKIIRSTTEAEELVEYAGRICYGEKSLRHIKEGSAPEFILARLEDGHESIVEHASATVEIVCNRNVSHQLVRHRLASYSQESARYCVYENDVRFMIPVWMPSILPGTYRNIEQLRYLQRNEFDWCRMMLEAESWYHIWLDRGWKAEEARDCLPGSLRTKIVSTMNFRQWRHFFTLRTSPRAYSLMRQITIPLLRDFQERFPVFFSDITV